MSRDILIRSVDQATDDMLARWCACRKATLAQMLTLAVGEYTANHEAELMAWARGEDQ